MAIDYLRRYATTQEKTDAPRPPGPSRPVESLLPGAVVEHELGRYFVAETTRPLDEPHGLHELAALKSVDAQRFAFIGRDPELAYVDLGSALFLDTETTGLSLGTGTYVFLVGAGYVEGSRFRVRQFFLTNPSQEAGFLDGLASFLGRFTTLVTFNGKAFDWPLLESRFIGSRRFRASPLREPIHLDLLHPARRLWKRRLVSCALTSLEENILGVHRTGQDVPGWMIPGMYFEYLRSRDARSLSGVFYHNLQDILSMASLTVHMDRVLANPHDPLVSDGRDFVSLGHQFDRAGDSERAVACLEEALDRLDAGSERIECLQRLAAIHKRERRWEAALQMWERLIDLGSGGALLALEERAKYYEHVERDYLEALEDVRRALDLLLLTGHASLVDFRRQLEHRQGRLINRAFQERRRGRSS